MTVLRVDTIAGTGTTFGPLLDGNLEFNSQNYIVLPKGSSNQQGVLRTTEDVIGVGGTYYDNLVLAMPFNEATGLRDVSSRNRNPGAYGNVAISTAQSKYYGSSAYFDGSSDWLQIESSQDFEFGSANFTVEFYTYVISHPGDTTFISRDSWTGGAGTAPWVIYYYNNTINFSITETLSSWAISGAGQLSLTTGQWNHIALVRNGSSFDLYVNGTKGTTGTFSGSILASTDPLVIGSYNVPTNPLGTLNGYIQDLRIYKGIAKYTANFTPPERIAETGVGFKTGALRYNTDSNKPELYDGNQWTELQISNVGLGTAGDTGPGARGLFGGGFTGINQNRIEYINISSTGNSIDFGDLIVARRGAGACSSSTRGVWGGGIGGGSPESVTNVLDYITISSTGDAQDFGDLISALRQKAGLSNSTRGVFSGGYTPSPTTIFTNVIEYLTIASTGDTKDFGDLSTTRYGMSACSSPTRGLFVGGTGTPTLTNIIEFITISTLGDTQDFGDLTITGGGKGVCSSSTRGVFGGGYTPTNSDVIEFITIATLGNAQNFGDLISANKTLTACSSSTRGVFGGGLSDVIQYVTIETSGNAVDFGDLLASNQQLTACSNAHGGL